LVPELPAQPARERDRAQQQAGRIRRFERLTV
jgi:hypothetical protein